MKTGTVHNRDSFLARISSTLGRDKVESTVSRPKVELFAPAASIGKRYPGRTDCCA